MEIIAYDKKGLLKALADGHLWQGPEHPITRHRALSLATNPLAEEGDTLLLLAREGQRLLGYIGLVPDRVRWRGREEAIHWATTGWVEPEARKTGLGAYLFLGAMEYCDERYAALDISDLAIELYAHMPGVRRLPDVPGATYVLGYAPEGIANPAKRAAALAVNWRQARRLRRRATELAAGLEFQHFHQLPGPWADWLRAVVAEQAAFNPKSPEVLDWMGRYPWVLSAPLPEAEQGKYRFSSVARHFATHNLALFSQGRLVGLLWVKNRDGNFGLANAAFRREDAPLVARALLAQVEALGGMTLTLYHPWLLAAFEALGVPCLRKDPRARRAVVSTLFDGVDFSNLVFADGDADCAFT